MQVKLHRMLHQTKTQPIASNLLCIVAKKNRKMSPELSILFKLDTGRMEGRQLEKDGIKYM